MKEKKRAESSKTRTARTVSYIDYAKYSSGARTVVSPWIGRKLRKWTMAKRTKPPFLFPFWKDVDF